MSILTKDFNAIQQIEISTKPENSIRIWEIYMAYAEKQAKAKILWYLKSIMVIPCVVMIPTIFVMAMLTTNYVWFVGLSVILFFSNVTAHIVDAKSTLYIPIYHGTIAIMILIPLIKYLIAL